MKMCRPPSQRVRIAIALVFGVLASMPLRAQERDPTVPPQEAGAATGTSAKNPWGSDGMNVIVRNGKPFLVVDTRLYAPGQKVGQFRIERITETEVWLREDKVLRKIPRFTGIQRHESANAPERAANKPKTRKTIKKAIAS